MKCDYLLSKIYSSGGRAENTDQISAFHVEDLSQHLNNLWKNPDTRYVRVTCLTITGLKNIAVSKFPHLVDAPFLIES
jgi:hypothetical protein